MVAVSFTPAGREGGPKTVICGNFPRKEFGNFIHCSLEITRETEIGAGLTKDRRNFKSLLQDTLIRGCASPLFEK